MNNYRIQKTYQDKENLKYHVILFFFTPVLGLLYSMKTGSLKTLRWSIFFFTAIYGSLFTFSTLSGELGTNTGLDGAVHWNNVYSHYQYLSFTEFWDELMAILSLAPIKGTNDEPYIHIVSYITGGVLNAPWLFFVVVGMVYAYFYSGAMVKILSHVNWKSNYNRFYFMFFVVLLVLWKNPMDMQTVRTWTGMWVLIYAVLSFHDTKKWKYLLLALVPPFIHIAYLAIAIPAWLVLFSGFRRPILYFGIFMISVFTSNLIENTNLISIASDSKVGESKVNAYYLDDKKQESLDEKLTKNTSTQNFYKNFEQYGVQYKVISGIIIFIFVFLRNSGFSKIENTLFSYGLAMASLANFSIAVYALYQRTWDIAAIFILALMLIFLSKQKLRGIPFSFIKVKVPLFIFTIFIIPFILFRISAFMGISSAYIILFPFFSWIQPESAISIREIIGFLL